MNVTFESLINVWDEQIPKLLIELVNHAVFTKSKEEFQAAVAQLSQNTDFDKFFAYGYGAHHYYLHQRLATDSSKYMDNRLLIVDFYRYHKDFEDENK